MKALTVTQEAAAGVEEATDPPLSEDILTPREGEYWVWWLNRRGDLQTTSSSSSEVEVSEEEGRVERAALTARAREAQAAEHQEK